MKKINLIGKVVKAIELRADHRRAGTRLQEMLNRVRRERDAVRRFNRGA